MFTSRKFHFSLIYSIDIDSEGYLRSFINTLADGNLLETLKLKSDNNIKQQLLQRRNAVCHKSPQIDLLYLRALSLNKVFSCRNHSQEIAVNLTEFWQFEFGYQLSTPRMSSSEEEQEVI